EHDGRVGFRQFQGNFPLDDDVPELRPVAPSEMAFVDGDHDVAAFGLGDVGVLDDDAGTAHQFAGQLALVWVVGAHGDDDGVIGDVGVGQHRLGGRGGADDEVGAGRQLRGHDVRYVAVDVA